VTTFSYTLATNHAAPPSDQQVRLNAAVAATTAIYIDANQTGGNDVSEQLLGFRPGDELYLEAVGDTAKNGRFRIVSVVNRSGYVEFTVSLISARANFTSTVPVTVNFTRVAPSPSAGYAYRAEMVETGTVIGQADDKTCAVLIACTIYGALQTLTPTFGRAHQIVILDSTATPVALIGNPAAT